MPVLPGHPPVDIVLRRSPRTRRFSLRVSQLDGRVTLSIPQRAREAEAMEFVRGQEDWLRGILARRPAHRPVTMGDQIPVEGRLLTLTPGPGRSVKVDRDILLLPGDPALAGKRVQAFLQTLARDRLAAASDHYAAQIGRKVTRITLRDTRSRWGSCAHDGALMYSWRLVMAPPSVLTYVAAHEVAHMLQMNHSPAYWAVVDRLYPGWQTQRKWLQTEGNRLHSFHFTA
ncbi:MAG: M48 family metallopeptidase [Pseudorhodobacter sp.]|nr:M48 family metallopeptidase [Pseudorhodobacter sp.]